MNDNKFSQKKNSVPQAMRRTEYIKKKQQIARRRRIRASIIIFLSVYIFLILIAGLILLIKLNKNSKANDDENTKYTYSVNKKNFNYDDSVYDGVLCVTSDILSELTDITVTKSENTVGFEFAESKEYVNFDLDSLCADVNGNKVEMTEKVGFLNGVLYIPLDFFENHVLGFIIEKDDATGICTISKDTTANPSFVMKKTVESPTIPDDSSEANQTNDFNFKTDVSQYEKYIVPDNRDEFLFLVNASNTLPQDYIPEDLTATKYTRQDGRAQQKLVTSACMALEAFLNEAAANGYDDITVTSGYRSYSYQAQLFEQEVALTGSEEEAAKSVNRPGSSEHQSGLCVDMHNFPAASTAFGDTDAAAWLEENAYKFGFILRYPEDKTEITGISYEPWHFRFVGRYHATKMHQLNMCLEEYMEYIKK